MCICLHSRGIIKNDFRFHFHFYFWSFLFYFLCKNSFYVLSVTFILFYHFSSYLMPMFYFPWLLFVLETEKTKKAKATFRKDNPCSQHHGIIRSWAQMSNAVAVWQLASRTFTAHCKVTCFPYDNVFKDEVSN